MALSWLMQAIITSLMSSSDVKFEPSSTPGTSAGANVDPYMLTQTNYGVLRGIVDFSEEPGMVKFLGIPFAKPPLGPLRFQKPEPPAAWTGVRDALASGSQCPQRILFEYVTENSSYTADYDEDCLYLNVYTPARDASAGLLPVMVWIHGGAYKFGAGSVTDGSYLARKGVVVVTFNYRLGSLGFMSTEDDVMPGNYGVLDQIAALKWVKENIAAFGGDPNQVTIFGQSAGSGSVSLLVLSPLAEGLFNRAIMESGVSLSPWAFAHPGTRIPIKTVTRMIGATLGCHEKDSAEFLKCMQNVDSDKLLNVSEIVSDMLGDEGGIIMVPRVESTFGFLPDLPIRLWSTGKFNHVDTIRGFNSDELVPVKENLDEGATREEFMALVEETLAPYAILDSDVYLKQIADRYIGNRTDPMSILQATGAVRTDFYFAAATVAEMKMSLSTAPEKNHYLYKFGYRVSISGYPDWIKAVHGDEMIFMFGMDKYFIWPPGYTPTKEDYDMAEQMMTLWTNFAKTGYPTSSVPQGAVKWEPSEPGQEGILLIDSTSRYAELPGPEDPDLYKIFLQKVDTALDPSLPVESRR